MADDAGVDGAGAFAGVETSTRMVCHENVRIGAYSYARLIALTLSWSEDAQSDQT